MRIMIKGGVWKNSEDEILKAAVMKYGKNQWARISSLMVRKSAKQCKARWYEWLDPSILKTEWTREEEEKLLHLAKIMPTQWRTIAPIVGRTATQCLEHYEKLLDQAQRAEEEGEAGPSAAGPSGPSVATTAPGGMGDARRLRPGEIDPTPESKPARPDPVDMDEDEKEMLSEARARLANTRGKKAKRKAREKQLDEAKRLAHLQKRRELLAAGIKVRSFRKSRRDIDYTTEIPFEKRPAPGFYDVTEEDARARKERMDSAQVGKLLEHYEGKRRDDIEAQERKRDEKRRKIFEEKDLPAALASHEKEEEMPVRRSKLVLPAPQVSDVELEAVVKSGNAARLDVAAGSKTAVTRHLVADYTPTPQATPVARTGTNVESWEEVKRRELANLRAYQTASSALTGGENTPLNESDFSGITPKRRVASTPNPLASPAPSSVAKSTPGGTPAHSSLTARTTLVQRDGLRINTADTEGLEKARLELLNRDIKRLLESLPEPKNEYIVVGDAVPKDEDMDAPEADPVEDMDMDMVEDALDTKERLRRQAAELTRRYLSQPATRRLPLPQRSFADQEVLEAASSSSPDAPQVRLVAAEVVRLIHRDDVVRSTLSEAADDAERVERLLTSLGEDHPVEEPELDAARKQVDEEVQRAGHCDLLDDGSIRGVLDSVNRHRLLSTNKQGLLTTVDVDNAEEYIGALATRMDHVTERVRATDISIGKVEKRTKLMLQGYQKRREKLLEELSQEFDRVQSTRTKLLSFNRLREIEVEAGPHRVAEYEKLVQQQEAQESELQARYKALVEA